MLDAIRNHQRLFMGLLLLLILPSFVAFGAWDLVPGLGANGRRVAVVDGQDITPLAWRQAHDRAMQQMRAQFGAQLPAAMLDSPEARSATLERLIGDQVLLASMRQAGLVVTDQQLRDLIAKIPEFQTKGQFDLRKAEAFLQARGLSTAVFEAQLRDDVSRQRLPALIAGTAIGSRVLARRLAQTESEQRSFLVQVFQPAEQLSKVQVSDQDLQAYYEANPARFLTPETLTAEFLVMRPGGSTERADAFNNLVYEQSDSLEPAAKATGAKVLVVPGLRRDGSLIKPLASTPAPDLVSALRSEALRTALFSADATSSKRNIEALEVAPGVLASARVVSVQPAVQQPFAQVAPEIRRLLIQEKALAAAKAAAQAWQQDAQRTGRTVVLDRTKPSEFAKALKLPADTRLGPMLDELLSAKFQPQQAGLVTSDDLVIGAVLTSQSLPAADAAPVQARLRGSLNALEQIEQRQGFIGWRAIQEKALGVKRYPDRLAAAAS